ncbi:MAG TPA: hypothetical protein VD713_06830, partial [Sphingomonadales bacterium]|nr:hypothetical protein [Sphingomonadales bacterium]
MTALIRCRAAACLWLALALSAWSAMAEEVRLETLAEVASVAPQRPFWIAIEITPRAGAVLPWFDPETGNLSISIKLTGRAGFVAGESILPAPELDPADGIYRYSGPFWVLQEVLPPPTLPEAGSYTVRGTVRWLGCLDTCSDRFGEFLISLPPGLGQVNPETIMSFASLRSHAPQLLPWPVRLEAKEGRVSLKAYLDPAAYGAITFLPEAAGNKPAFEALQDFEKTDTGFVARFSGRDFSGLKVIRGLLFAEGEKGMEIFRAAISNFPEAPGAGIAATMPSISLTLALGLAFLGGLILNLMPCVFPVLSLKIFGLVKASHRSRASFVLDGLAYTAGVVFSFVIVALLLLTFRAGG